MFTRRTFSTVLLAGVADLASNSQERRSDDGPSKTIFVFTGMNNQESGSGRMAIGALTCTQFLAHQRAIEEIRRKYRYYSRLLYRSTDKFRVPFANAVIDYFARHNDLRFTAYLFSGYDRDSELPLLRQQFVVVIERALAQYHNGPKDAIVLHFRGLGWSRADDLELVRYVKKQIPNVVYFTESGNRRLGLQKRPAGAARPAPNNLAQLGGFLSGNAAALSDPPKEAAKQALLKSLAVKLGVKDPSMSSYQNNTKYRVTLRSYE